jgi:hypothetical protein
MNFRTARIISNGMRMFVGEGMVVRVVTVSVTVFNGVIAHA